MGPQNCGGQVIIETTNWIINIMASISQYSALDYPSWAGIHVKSVTCPPTY
jgi:hypothetical protein